LLKEMKPYLNVIGYPGYVRIKDDTMQFLWKGRHQLCGMRGKSWFFDDKGEKQLEVLARLILYLTDRPELISSKLTDTKSQEWEIEVVELSDLFTTAPKPLGYQCHTILFQKTQIFFFFQMNVVMDKKVFCHQWSQGIPHIKVIHDHMNMVEIVKKGL
jgi:hypothetical protein